MDDGVVQRAFLENPPISSMIPAENLHQKASHIPMTTLDSCVLC